MADDNQGGQRGFGSSNMNENEKRNAQNKGGRASKGGKRGNNQGGNRNGK